jgi:hypothetical protein
MVGADLLIPRPDGTEGGVMSRKVMRGTVAMSLALGLLLLGALWERRRSR